VRVREQDRRKQARRRTRGTPAQRQRIAARAEVRMAKARGDLEAQPCERCGTGVVQAHHEDYAQPLVVRWLCRPCHEAVHAEVA